MEKIAYATVSNIKPVHKHDCRQCVFLGALEQSVAQFDLYACEKRNPTTGHEFVEYVARHGSDPNDYGSGPAMIKGSPYSLAEKLWEKRKANSTRWVKSHPRFWVAGLARRPS